MATRLIALAAEKKYPWLTTVLDTYYISDSQVEEHLARIAKKGINPACHKGCHACCLKATVPFTEPELTAISWYASEVLSDEIRARVKQRLFEHAEILECPFLAMITTSSKAKSVTAKRKAFEAGFIVANAKNMHEFDWTIIAKTMAFFDGDDS